MLNSCRNSRIVGPSGIWEYEQLIGAKVKVSSLPVSNFFGCFSGGGSNDLLTIKDIYFRISLDGKTITVIELTEYPGKIFTWKVSSLMLLVSLKLYVELSYLINQFVDMELILKLLG